MDEVSPRLQKVASRLPKSPKDMGRLRRRLASAGIYSFGAAVLLLGARTWRFRCCSPARC